MEHGQILVDTACARTVAGMRWALAVVDYVYETYGYRLEMVDDNEPFRFGLGPTIRSVKALLLPMEWGRGQGAVLRISLVNCEVPPLMSRAVLRHLGGGHRSI